ncbi:MAG: hypothetical protein CO119_10315 [Flavobacteriales bacterium CG_4_9_14_3_um_filter_40_17]|nr:MAG: hypothetical protein CO119_10315 [Flavobacteriales bacterium CG_4_9_14_3_um_filter_40_17]
MRMLTVLTIIRLSTHGKICKICAIAPRQIPKNLLICWQSCLKTNFGKLFQKKNKETITETSTVSSNIHIIIWDKLYG